MWSLGAERPRCPRGSVLTLTLGLGLGPRRVEGLRQWWGPHVQLRVPRDGSPPSPGTACISPLPLYCRPLGTMRRTVPSSLIAQRETGQARPPRLVGPPSGAQAPDLPNRLCAPRLAAPSRPPCEAFVMLQQWRPLWTSGLRYPRRAPLGGPAHV